MATGSMLARMRGAAMLDAATFEEIEADTSATGQAAAVVAIVAVARAIGAAGQGEWGIVGAILSAILGWLIWAGVTYLIGDKLLGGTATWGELLRTLGFAQTPGILMAIAFIPILGWFIGFVVAVWVLVAGIVALKHALDFGMGKTILTAVLGWLAIAIPAAIFGIAAR
jgi:hypothetical protein